jgi:hypothetical protein
MVLRFDWLDQVLRFYWLDPIAAVKRFISNPDLNLQESFTLNSSGKT